MNVLFPNNFNEVKRLSKNACDVLSLFNNMSLGFMDPQFQIKQRKRI